MRKLRKNVSLAIIFIICISMLSNSVIYATGTEMELNEQEMESIISDICLTEEELSTEAIIDTNIEEDIEVEQNSVLSEQEFVYEDYSIKYSLVNQWDGGYQAEIKITNIGAKDIVNWGIEFDLNQEISNIWNALVMERSDNHYIIQNSGWNQDISLNESISFGFVVNEDFISIPEEFILSYDINEEKELSSTFVGEGYEVDFLVTNEWSESYNAEVTIRNTGSEPIENWSLEFELNNDIKDIWNVLIVEASTEGVYTIKHNGWNQDIHVGSEISFGFTAEGEFVDFPEVYLLNTKKVEVSEGDYKVSYEIINSWDDGFTANIIIKNNTSETLEDWALEFDYNNQIDNIWNAIIVEQSNQHYVLNNAGYNQNILAGETLTIGVVVQSGDVDEILNNILVTKYIMEEDTEMMKFLTNDTDGDSLPDYYEEYITYTDPNKVKTDDINHDGNRDEDGDGLSNLEEYMALTNAYLEDTEYDGLTDYDEIMIYGTNPSEYDTDFDGVGDWTEIQRGTDPLNPDTNGDGITDGEEVITFGLCENQYVSLEPDKMGYSVNITMTGKGDYNNKISLLDGTGDYQFPEIEYIVGAPLYIKHDEIDFEKATISFALTEKVLFENDINNIQIASYNEETHEIEFMDTQIDKTANVLSCETTHFSYYFLVDIIKLRAYYLIEGIDEGEVISDVVFVVDTTGSMSSMIYNTTQGIIQAANLTQALGLDIRYALVDYKDIYEDGIPAQNLGWCVTEDEFVEQIQKLNITGGGDIPESAVDALETARLSEFRDSAMKSIVLVTDASYKEGTNYEGLSSMEEEIERLVEDGINVSVITNSYIGKYYSELVENTGGKIFNANSDFSESLVEVYTSVAEDAEKYTWVRLSDGTVVKLLVDPENASEDDPTDTDGDGTSDMHELTEKEILIYEGMEYVVWNYNTNPYKSDIQSGTNTYQQSDDVITVFEMYDALRMMTAALTMRCYYEVYYNIGMQNYASDMIRFLSNTVILYYLQSNGYSDILWKILTRTIGMEGYSNSEEAWNNMVSHKLEDEYMREDAENIMSGVRARIYDVLENNEGFKKYQAISIIDPIEGIDVGFAHFSASCNAHYNQGESVLVYPIELSSWGGDLQTLSVDIASQCSDDDSVDKIFFDTFLAERYSFSHEDLLADVDAVNISDMLENQHLVNAYRDYYIELGVSQRYTLFLEHYDGNLHDKMDEILPDDCFSNYSGRVQIDDVQQEIINGDIIVPFYKIPFVYVRMLSYDGIYYPTLAEVQIIKESFYQFIIQSSNQEQ